MISASKLIGKIIENTCVSTGVKEGNETTVLSEYFAY